MYELGTLSITRPLQRFVRPLLCMTKLPKCSAKVGRGDKLFVALGTQPAVPPRQKSLANVWIVRDRERPGTDAAMAVVAFLRVAGGRPAQGTAPRHIVCYISDLPFFPSDEHNVGHRPNG
jgi:hypothetical protein